MKTARRMHLLAVVVTALGVHAVAYAQESNVILPTTALTSGRYSYEAKNSITASAFSISNGASVTFQAGSQITLNPGFHATASSAGTAFHAFVSPVYASGSPAAGQVYSNYLTGVGFVVTPPGSTTIAGGDIYLQAFDSNGNFRHQCPINFTVSPNLIGMSDSGQEMALPGTASITNASGECSVSGMGSTITPGTNSVTVNLVMMFPASMVNTTYVVASDTYDGNGNLSPLEYTGTLSIVKGGATLTITTSPSVVSAPLNQQKTFSVTITGFNGFTNSDLVTLTPFGWPGNVTYPSSVTLSSNNNGNPSATFQASITPTQSLSTTPGFFAYNARSGTIGLMVSLTESQLVTQSVLTQPPGLIVFIDGTEYTTPSYQQWAPGSTHHLMATSQGGANGTPYTFFNWTDGVTQQTRTITAPTTPTTYTAAFTSQVTGTDPKEYIYLNGRLIAIEVTK